MIEALEYVKKFSGCQFLIKLGGSILENTTLMKKICFDFQLLRAANIKIILVHGGGKAIDQALKVYKLKSVFKDGLRVTTSAQMKVIEMVLSGQINKLLVRTLNAMGISAVGLSGADHQMLCCQPWSSEHGHVGRIQTINAVMIEQLHAIHLLPVIAPIGVGEKGKAYNINADWVASCLAVALKVDKLIYLTDQDGIQNKDHQVISTANAAGLHHLIQDKVVSDGMLTKVSAILHALKKGIDNIHIVNGHRPHAVIQETFTKNGVGTLCQLF